MFRQRLLLGSLLVVMCAFSDLHGTVAASDYVWARSGYGAMPWGHNASSFSNGYGGYYVPRNAYGNNHEGVRPFTNPNGFIVPASPAARPAATHQLSAQTTPVTSAMTMQQVPEPSMQTNSTLQPIPAPRSFSQRLKRFLSH